MKIMKMKIFILVFIFQGIFGSTVNSQQSEGNTLVSGEITTIEEFPHQLALLFFGIQRCGAAIITENWAITAGHCVADVVTAARHLLTLRVGSSERDNGGVIYQVESYLIHENLDHITLDYDVAVIKPDRPFEFSARVQPILLPIENEVVKPDTVFTLTGWGVFGISAAFPAVLRQVKTPFVDNKICAELYAGRSLITDRMLCAGFDTGSAFCTNDEGAPLVYDGTLYGLASWSRGCNMEGNPGVYINVASVRSWISEKTGA